MVSFWLRMEIDKSTIFTQFFCVKKMPTIDIQGIPHVYELTPKPSSGEPVALVFIHGWLLSRNYWKPLVEKLSLQYQCLTYDLRGFGDSAREAIKFSPMPESHYTLGAYAEDLANLLLQLNLDNVWLVGHSLGGLVGVTCARSFPERIKGVICLNSGGGIYLKEEFERFRAAGCQLVKFRRLWLSRLPLMDWFFARMMVRRSLSLAWGKQRLKDFLIAEEKAALGSLLDSTTEAEVHYLPQLVAQLTQPVYFLAGLQDKVMEPKYVHHLASFHPLFAHCANNVIEIAECGHLSMLEQPETVEAKISEILNLHT